MNHNHTKSRRIYYKNNTPYLSYPSYNQSHKKVHRRYPFTASLSSKLQTGHRRLSADRVGNSNSIGGYERAADDARKNGEREWMPARGRSSSRRCIGRFRSLLNHCGVLAENNPRQVCNIGFCSWAWTRRSLIRRWIVVDGLKSVVIFLGEK